MIGLVGGRSRCIHWRNTGWHYVRSNPVQPLSAIRSSWPPALFALWRRAGGSNPDPAAQPGAVLAVDECIAEDLEHITTVGLVAAASASQRRLEHPRALEWNHIAHSDAGRTPRHPHHAVVAVTEPI